jgi:antitoxin ParD1/3/4
MTVVLTPELEELIAEKVRSGQYHSPTEVVHEALQLLNERDLIRQHRMEELSREIAIGIEEANRGELVPLDVEAIKAKARRRSESDSREP